MGIHQLAVDFAPVFAACAEDSSVVVVGLAKKGKEELHRPSVMPVKVDC